MITSPRNAPYAMEPKIKKMYVPKTQQRKADAILCSDIHLQETKPVCREDDFVEKTQWEKLYWLSQLQKKHDCPVIHAGDLYDYWKPSPWLLSRTMKYLPSQFYTVYGNHDLPQHNMELRHKSGVYCLGAAGRLTVLSGGHWGGEPQNETPLIDNGLSKKIAVWHVMTYQGKEPYPGCTVPTSRKLLRKYPQFDLIVTGDNHVPFVEQYKGRLLVNPGSLFRTTAKQVDFRPRVYLWYADTNTVEPVYVPIEDVVSRQHLEKEEERNDRIQAFIETMDIDWDATMSYEENLKRHMEENETNEEVKQIIYKAID